MGIKLQKPASTNDLPSDGQNLLLLRKIATSCRMTESIDKELIECLCVIVVNASTSLRMLAAAPPNVEGARETRASDDSQYNRAAEAVSQLSGLFTQEK